MYTKWNHKIVLMLAAIFIMAGAAMAGRTFSDNIWEQTDKAMLPQAGIDKTMPTAYETFRLNKSALKELLDQAPEEYTDAPRIILSMPMPDGSLSRFEIEHSLVVERGMLTKFPELGATYRGRGIDDPTAYARFDFLPSGFHSMILSTNGTVIVDPYATGDTTNYISYFKNDRALTTGFKCDVKSDDGFDSVISLDKNLDSLDVLSKAPASSLAPEVISGTQLRTYRLALAADWEYCNAVGSNTLVGCQAAQVLIMNRVNGVYEKDVAIHMNIIANNSMIVYAGNSGNCTGACTSANDPYTDNDGSTMLGQNQTTIDTRIGTANYDIGHVFSTGGGGIASLNAPCNAGNKAQGVTGLPNPVGDDFAIDYVAHEMGHQWGANHTFNSTQDNCGGGNRAGSSAYEPGSGITIMAYAGICGAQDLAQHSIETFHVKSLEVITAYSQTGAGNTCAVTTASGNTPPTVTGPGNFTIPKQSAFALTATASDVNVGDSITYDWQEYDLGASTVAVPNTDADGIKPIFRPYLPTASGTRYFPSLQYIRANANVPPSTFNCGRGVGAPCLTGELLPTVSRTMVFQVVARDNHPATGGINSATSTVTVDGNSGPFVVTAPNTGVSFTGNTFQTVTWNVANTAGAPVNAANVKISFSSDGGLTFPTVITASTANDGSESVLIPNTATTTARIKVEAVGNIFFDMSDVNFTVTAGGGTPTATNTATGTPSPTFTNTATATATPTACGSWVAGPPANPAGYAVPGAVGSDNKFYIAGGQTADSTPIISNQFQRFDPTTNTWSSLAPLPVAISQGIMGAGTGKIYVAGGFTGGTTVLNTLSIYDIATNTWSSGANMPGIVEAGAGVVFNGKFYVIGGDDFNNALSSNFIYDIATNAWTTGAVVPSGRTNTVATVAGGLIYVYGGLTGASFTATDTLLSYNPVTNAWVTIGSAGTIGARGNYGGISPFGTGQLLITAGATTAFVATNTTRIFNIAGGTFTAGPTMTTARAGHAQGTLPDGRVIVADGLDTASTVTSTVELIGNCPTGTPTNTNTPTPTSTGTIISSPTPTFTATRTNTNTPTATATSTGSPACTPSQLYDNGPIVTNPTGGAGGAPLSALQTGLGLNVLGFGSTTTAPGNTLADDFVVPAGGWTINTVTLYGYQTGSATSPSTFNTARIQIWNGVPGGVGSTVIFGDLTTNRFASSAWSGVYRATDTAPTGTTRPIMATIANVGTTLPAGTYWLEFQLGGTGASGPFVPPVSILGQVNKPGSNAVQGTVGTPTTYAAVIDTGTAAAAQDIPFLINGTGPCSSPSGTPTASSTPTRTSTFTPTATATATATGTPAGGELIYGMTVTALNGTTGADGVNLVRFNSATPGTVTTIGPFTGLTSGHAMRSIDFRPATGQLFGLSTSATGTAAQLYTINLTTAACTPVGTGFNLGTNGFTFVEMDFNPVVDRIRIVTAGDGTVGNNNFRANPNDGTLVAQDTALAFDASSPRSGSTDFNIIGGAYSNNVAGATQTTLYAWDFFNDALLTIGGVNGTPSPNGGLMFTVNTPAGFLTFSPVLGMDISGATSTMYVTHDDAATGTKTSLYTRNVTTGAQTLVGDYPVGMFVGDLSVFIAGGTPTPTNTATATPTGTPVGQVFANAAAMCTTLGNGADLYPSNITVVGGPTMINAVRVTLFNVVHQFPDNMDFLLVGPTGQKFILMADAGGSLPQATPGATLTFDDNAGQVLPDSGPLVTGSFEPTSWEAGQATFPAPAPAAPYNEPGSTVGGTGTQTLFGNFGGTNANGVWSLYMRDDAGLFSRPAAITGCVNGGWQLQFIQSTAASASVSGRVATANGAGIRNAKIVVTGGSLTEPLIVTTGSLGYYTVDGLRAGQTYVVTVFSKRYTFSNPTRVVSLVDNVTDADFTADPQ